MTAVDAPAGLFVSFKNSHGFRLAGDLHVPSGVPPCAVAVCTQGRQTRRTDPRVRALAAALVHASLAAFVLDFTGRGDSEGTEPDDTSAQRVDDLRAAIDVLLTLDEIDGTRVGVCAEGTDATAALRLGATDPRVRALVLRCARPAGAPASCMTVPTLLLVGARDEAAHRVNETLLEQLAGPRRLDLVPEAGPLLDEPAALAHAATATAAWFRRHLA